MPTTPAIVCLFLCGCVFAQQSGAADQRPIFWPADEEVRAALAIFDACPKERAFAGLGTEAAVEKARARYKAGDPPPDAEWVDYWMGKSDQFIYDMISPDNPRSLVPNYNEGCPLHLGKSSTILPVWGKPDTFRCKFGHEEWAPGMKVKNPATGELVEIVDDGQGWRPPEGFPQRREFYFKAAYRMYMLRSAISNPYAGHVDFDGPDDSGRKKKHKHKPVVQALAWAYAVTRKQEYADKALIVLNRLAENYRRYNSRVDTKVDWRKSPSRGYICDHVFENFHIENLAAAYDLLFDAVKDADATLKFFKGKHGCDYNGDGRTDTEDLRHNIEHNLFGYCLEFLLRSAKLGTSNGRMANLGCMANLGLIFRNDRIIQEVVDGPAGIRHGVMGAFYREGRSHEDTSSYARFVNNLYLEMGRILGQYRGRKIYTNGLDVHKEFGSRYRMIEAWFEKRSCDGGYFGYGDGGGTIELPARPEKLSATFLGHEVGMTLLHQGGDHRTRKHVLLYHANSGVGHGHPDQLMLKIMAYGHDFGADLGYPMNMGSPKRREWLDTTITHPTVLIDEKTQARGTCASASVFGGCDWAQVASAYSYDAYPEAALYHRTAAVVEVDNDRHFVVDVFRVRGGSKHDYAFHSHSGPDGTNFEITCDGQLAERAGTLAGEDVEYLSPTRNGYSYVKDVRHGSVEGTFTATWRLGDDAGTGYSLHVLGASGREIFVGKGEARGIVHRSPLDAYLIVRGSGEEGLATTFIAVHEPFQGNDMGIAIRALPMPEYAEDRMPAGIVIATADGKEFRFQSVIANQKEGRRHEGPDGVLIEGPRGRLAVNWPTDAGGSPVRGEVVGVDYQSNRMRVTAKSDLINMVGRVIYIQNPLYAKTTAFDIKAVERIAGDQWWIETELEPLLATNGIRDVNAEKGRITSFYNMAKLRECPRLFDGKVIVCRRNPKELMRVASVRMGKNDVPTQVVTLRSAGDARKFGPDDTYAIYDCGPGDTWYICTTGEEKGSG